MFKGTFSYKKDADVGMKQFTIRQGAQTFRVRIRKDTLFQARIYFMDVHGALIPPPQHVNLVHTPTNANIPIIGDTFVIFWSESYTLRFAEVPLIHINNQRSQAIRKQDNTVDLQQFIPQPFAEEEDDMEDEEEDVMDA